MILNPSRLVTDSDGYYAHPALSASVLRKLHETGHPSALLAPPPVINDSMRLGSAADCYLLEPSDFTGRYAVLKATDGIPTTRTQEQYAALVVAGEDPIEAYRKSYSAFSEDKAKALRDSLAAFVACQQKRQTPISQEQYETIQKIADSARAHPLWDRINEGEKQVKLIGTTDTNPYLAIKGMLDSLGEDTVWDLKTTATFDDFRWSFFKRGYDIQFGVYGLLSGREKSGVLVVESVPPFRSKVVDVTVHAMASLPKVRDLIERAVWHIGNRRFTHAREYYESGGWEAL